MKPIGGPRAFLSPNPHVRSLSLSPTPSRSQARKNSLGKIDEALAKILNPRNVWFHRVHDKIANGDSIQQDLYNSEKPEYQQTFIKCKDEDADDENVFIESWNGQGEHMRCSNLLHFAVLKDNPKALKELLEAGFNPDYRLKVSMMKSKVEVTPTKNEAPTPLMRAAWLNKIECAQVLLDNGADALATNDFGQTAYDVARQFKPPYHTMPKKLRGAKNKAFIGQVLEIKSEFGTGESYQWQHRELENIVSKLKGQTAGNVIIKLFEELKVNIPGLKQMIMEKIDDITLNFYEYGERLDMQERHIKEREDRSMSESERQAFLEYVNDYQKKRNQQEKIKHMMENNEG